MRSRALVAVMALAVLALPVALAGTRYATYVEHVVVQMMILGLYAMAWDFLNGYVGMFSFGHAAFFGAGAYAAGILIVRGGVTFAPVVVLLALAVSVLVGLGVGFLASRVGSVAVFLVTFACAEALYLIVLADPRGLTAGDNGLPGVVPAPLLGLAFNHQVSFYYVALAVLALSFVALVGHHAEPVRPGAARHPRERAASPLRRIPRRAVQDGGVRHLGVLRGAGRHPERVSRARGLARRRSPGRCRATPCSTRRSGARGRCWGPSSARASSSWRARS